MWDHLNEVTRGFSPGRGTVNDSSSPTPSPQHAVVATHTEKSYKQADGEPDCIAQATAIVRLADVVDERAGKAHYTEIQAQRIFSVDSW